MEIPENAEPILCGCSTKLASRDGEWIYFESETQLRLIQDGTMIVCPTCGAENEF